MRIPDDSFLKTLPIAHRGLHDAKKGIPENSCAAFENARLCGYAAETDVRFTKDGKLVAFHDDDLERMTGERAKVIDRTYAELCKLRLDGTSEKIPLFSELLELIDGKIPLLIEIKNQPERKDIVQETLRTLSGYRGEFALQTFHPLYLLQIKRLAPHILRGQLGTFIPKFSPQNHVVKNMSLNFLTSPDFISYNIENLPFSKARRKDTLLLSWTVRDHETLQKAQKYADNIIFEDVRPDLS